MFLSSRWAIPSSEVAKLPLTDFNKQKVFWEHCKWGLADDLLAYQHSTYLSVKSGKIQGEVSAVKDTALYFSVPKKFKIETTSTVRKAFMTIASGMRAKRAPSNVPALRPVNVASKLRKRRRSQ